MSTAGFGQLCNESTIQVLVQGTYYQFANWDPGPLTDGTTVDAAAGTITVTATGVYRIILLGSTFISANLSGSNVTVQVYVNGAPLPGETSFGSATGVTGNAFDTKTIFLDCIYNGTAGDVISLRGTLSTSPVTSNLYVTLASSLLTVTGLDQSAGGGLPQRGLIWSNTNTDLLYVIPGDLVNAWGNAATGGYVTALLDIPFGSSTQPSYNPSGINGRPTVDFAEGTASWGHIQTSNGGNGSIDFFWTASFAGVVLYNGTVILDPTSGFLNSAGLFIFGDPSQPITGVAIGLDSVDATKIRLGAFIETDSTPTYGTVISSAVAKSLPHYFVITYDSNGMVTIYLDDLAPVVAGPFFIGGFGGLPITPFNTGSPTFWLRPNFGVDSSVNFSGSILEFDIWKVALNPSEISAAQSWLKAQGGL